MKSKLGISFCYGIIFVVYSVVLFVLGLGSTSGFWLGYGCTLLMLALCLFVVWRDCFGGKIAHLQFTLGTVITACFVAHLILGIIVSFLPHLWAAVIEIVLLGMGALCVLSVLLGGKMVVDRMSDVQNRQQFVRMLTTALAPLANKVSDMEARKKVEALQEAVRFSDPVSMPELEPLEQRIAEQSSHLSQRVEVGDWDGVCALCATLTQLLKERNRRCKELK